MWTIKKIPRPPKIDRALEESIKNELLDSQNGNLLFLFYIYIYFFIHIEMALPYTMFN